MSENNKSSKQKNMQSAFKNISAAVKGLLPTPTNQMGEPEAEQKQTIQISAATTTAGNNVGDSVMRNETSTNANLLGEEFRQAREELGYKYEDLTEHTGLSTDEIEALELGQYDKIEQQDYLEYYVHNYATLLGLDSDLALEHYRQYIVPETVALQTAENTAKFDIHDEQQYDEVFIEEAKKTIEALEESELTALDNYDHIEPEINFGANQPINHDDNPTPKVGGSGSSYVVGSINVSNLNDKSATKKQSTDVASTANQLTLEDGKNQYLNNVSSTNQTVFPWLRVLAAGIFVLALAVSIYFMVTLQQSGDTANIANVEETATDANETMPEVAAAIVKKNGTLETRIIAKGNDDANAATATTVQKPLIMRSQAPVIEPNDAIETEQAATTNNIETASGASSAVKQNGSTSSVVEQSPAIAATTEVESDDVDQTPLSALPSDENLFSLHATQNNWLLIEDDASQILFSGELTPEKIFTLPKIKGVIISLGNAGVIDVYKGKTLLGKLGKKDESLDLASIETRLNLITETAINSN